MIIFQDRFYGGNTPLTHARIAHANNWHNGTVAASTTESGYFADAPNNSLTYEKWKPTTFPATWECDFGSSKLIDYCVIGAHTLTGCSIVIQSWDGSAWVDETTATTITSNMPIMCLFASTSVTKARVSIASGSTLPTIAIIKFGATLSMTQPMYGGHTPIDMARETRLRSNYSNTGEFLGRTKQRTFMQSSFDWTHIQASWVRGNWKSVQKALDEDPFFIAWRPDTFSEVALCTTDETPIPTNMGVRDFMAVSIRARAYGYE